MLIAEPCWTAKNLEDITQFIFERFKTPAFCIMDSALATSYAFAIANACVVDIGFEKVDVTAVTEFQISARGSVPDSGGEAMTRRLTNLLQSKGFTRDMGEQLKKSAICEILPPGTALPGNEGLEEPVSNPAAAASTGATSSGPDVRVTEAPRGPGPDTEVGDEDTATGPDNVAEDDGVLDVASIVASGKTQEFLAKKEKEKAEKAAARKANKEKDARDAAEAAARSIKLPNSKRLRAVFHYEASIAGTTSGKRQKTPEPTSAIEPTSASATGPIDEPRSAVEAPASAVLPEASAPTDGAARKEQIQHAKREEKRKKFEEEHPDKMRMDIEIGTERFLAASDGILDTIADTIYRTILSVDDTSKRQDAWDGLVICGSGSKVRGFKDSLLATLNNRFLVSPSSATMFMSELPSNMATPSGTGSMTPNASFMGTPPHQPPTASAVNPLLLAATTASNPALANANSSYGGLNGTTHSSHSQSPTSIKTAIPPSYFPEWKSYEEAVFLGSQIAAKVIFVVDQGTSKGCLTRMEFNEEGPSAIHQM